MGPANRRRGGRRAAFVPTPETETNENKASSHFLVAYSSRRPQTLDGHRERRPPRSKGPTHPSPAPPVLALALHRALHGDVTGAADHHRVRRVLEQLLFQGPLIVLLLLIDLVEIRHPETPRPADRRGLSRDWGRDTGWRGGEGWGESLPRAPRPRSSFSVVSASATEEMGSWPSAAPPPLPSAITTTQCQHPPKGRHLHQHCRDRRSSNSGNHSNSQSLPQREHPATTSRDFPGAGGRVSGRVGARARGLAGGSAHVRPRALPQVAFLLFHPPSTHGARSRRRGPALQEKSRWRLRRMSLETGGFEPPTQRTELWVSSGALGSPEQSLTKTTKNKGPSLE